VDDYAEHFFFGGGFAGPDFELAGSLVDEHFDAGDDGEAFFAGHADQRRVDGVVDQVEDEAGVELLRFEERGGLDALHADGRCINDDVEIGFGDLLAANDFRLGLAGEFFRGVGGAVPDENFGTFFDQAEDGCASCSACAEDEDLCSSQWQTTLERTDDGSYIGIEAVEFAILRADDGIAGADFFRERIGFCEVLDDLGFEGHGDGEALQRDFAGEREQVVEARGLERQEDAVDRLAAEGDVVHERRERVADGIAGDSIDLGGGIDVVDAPGFAQGAGFNLAGAGFFSGMRGGEGEDGTGAEAEDAADDSLLAHGDADEVGFVAAAVEEAHHGDVVGQGFRRRDDFDELGLERQDAVEDGVEVFGAIEIVIADDERGAEGAEFFELRGLGVLGGLQLDVNKMTTGLCGFLEDLELGGDGAFEFSAGGGATTSGDGGDFAAFVEKRF